MAIIGSGSDPLPYQPIRIVDVSPYRSSVRSKPIRESRIRTGFRRARRNALVVLPSVLTR